MLLEIKQLNYSHPGDPDLFLFKQLDFAIAAGEHAVIVGDSGGGKSTLIRLLADCQHSAIDMHADSDPVLLLQEGALLDHLTVLENLMLVACSSNFDASKKATLERVESVLDSLNIAESLQSLPVSQLSGGQSRRVAIARALLKQPQVVLFDEPDAGLDVLNLQDLAGVIDSVRAQGAACVTISHNPLFIAQIATHVYKLHSGKLNLLVNWGVPSSDQNDLQTRQLELQALLLEPNSTVSSSTNRGSARARAKASSFGLALQTFKFIVTNLFKSPSSFKDAFRFAGHTLLLSFITGVVFYALVGMMLGATTLAVVKLLADRALTGVVAWFVSSADLLELMRGRFALYLGPAVGAMLFAARSGSLVTSWVGELVRSRQLDALRYLQINVGSLVSVPVTLTLWLAAAASIVWFTFSVWLGGVVAAQQLFDLANPVSLMQLTAFDITLSQIKFKLVVYSAICAWVTAIYAFMPKPDARTLSAHTTKAIVVSTVLISLSELLLILF